MSSSEVPIKRSLGIAFITQYAELAIGFVGVMILARIITSEEIGIYSVAAFLMALLHVFRDFGVAKYVIQAPQLTRDNMRSALGVAILLAWAMALLLLALRQPVIDFYDEPRLHGIMTVMAASFAVTPVGSLFNAIYRRNMQLRKVAAVRIGSALCGTVVSVVLALRGHGAMSLAWSNFAGIVMFGLIAVALRQGAIPLLPRFTHMREILQFGSIASLGTLANVGSSNSPDVIIAKSISLDAAGYFSRGNGLVQIFKTLVMGAVLPLVLPYFAALRRDSSDIVQPYRMAITYLTGFAWPFFGVMAVLALPAMRTLYGPNWDISAPLVQILCAAGAISMLTIFAGDVMIANGHVKQVTKMQLMTQPVRVVAVLAGSLLGLHAVAWGIVLTELVVLAGTSHLLQRTAGIGLGAVLGATARSALVTGCAVAGPLLLMLYEGSSGMPLVDAVLGGLLALAGWLLGVIWSHHPIRGQLVQARVWLGARLPSRS